jgi:hypothetical protein
VKLALKFHRTDLNSGATAFHHPSSEEKNNHVIHHSEERRDEESAFNKIKTNPSPAPAQDDRIEFEMIAVIFVSPAFLVH